MQLKTQLRTKYDLSEAILLGQVGGSKAVHLTGRRLAIDAESELWGGTNPRPFRPELASLAGLGAAAQQLTAQSTSANDAFAGTGANVILIEYLDENGFERMAQGIMAGFSPAQLYQVRAEGVGNSTTLVPVDEEPRPVPNAVRVQRAYVIAAGASASNEGTISIYLGPIGAGAESATIVATENITKASSFTVPRGMVAKLDGVGYGTSRALAGDVRIYTRALGKPVQKWSTFEASSGALAVPLSTSIRLAGLGEFTVTMQKDGGGAAINGFSVLQPQYMPDPTDPDPNPELQAMALG